MDATQSGVLQYSYAFDTVRTPSWQVQQQVLFQNARGSQTRKAGV